LAGFKEILKHGSNYLIANLATRALAFVSIPVYTRILSTSDFGTTNIFLGVGGILSNILTLCCDQSISRYYFDKKNDEDFKRFVGTSISISSIIFLINTIIFVALSDHICKLVGLDRQTTLLLLPYTFINIIGLTYQQIYTPMKESKKIALSSLSRVYLGFFFAIAFILYFDEKKYIGQILGLLTAGLIMIFVWSRGIAKYFIFSFEKKYFKYILTFSIPLIPYVLSGVIIEQFGKIAIGATFNSSQAGFYSLALTIGSLVSIVTAVTHQAWSPYYFEYMNAKNYSTHDRDIVWIFKITLICAMIISCFGKELGMLLAKPEFTGSLYLVPIFTFGFVFHQLAYVYMRNFSFVHKTIYSSVVVIAAGIVNIVINLVAIPKMGELGAAFSLVASYLFMAIFAWFVNKFKVKCYGTPIKALLLPVGAFAVLSAPLSIFYNLQNIFIAIGAKLLLLLTFIFLIGWREKKLVLDHVKNIKWKR